MSPPIDIIKQNFDGCSLSNLGQLGITGTPTDHHET